MKTNKQGVRDLNSLGGDYSSRISKRVVERNAIERLYPMNADDCVGLWGHNFTSWVYDGDGMEGIYGDSYAPSESRCCRSCGKVESR